MTDPAHNQLSDLAHHAAGALDVLAHNLSNRERPEDALDRLAECEAALSALGRKLRGRGVRRLRPGRSRARRSTASSRSGPSDGSDGEPAPALGRQASNQTTRAINGRLPQEGRWPTLNRPRNLPTLGTLAGAIDVIDE